MKKLIPLESFPVFQDLLEIWVDNLENSSANSFKISVTLIQIILKYFVLPGQTSGYLEALTALLHIHITQSNDI